MTRRPRGDEGTSLIFALILIGVVALVAGALVNFTAVGLRASTVTASERGQVYAAEGAIQGAINNMRYDLDKGVTGGTACDYTPDQNTNTVNGTLSVSCTVVDTGTVVSGGTGARTQPRNAILTLASGASNAQEGLIFKMGGSAELTINGSVFSNTFVSVDKNDIQIKNANLTTKSTASVDSCSSTSLIKFVGTAAGVRRCGFTGPTTGGTDPNYSPALASAPTAAPTITCASSRVVSFAAGASGAVLSALPNVLATAAIGTSSCKTATIYWFQPGVYYFNFVGAATWEAANTDVVAGSPVNWTPTSSTATLPASGTDSCYHDDKDHPQGTQFVFGGNSRIHFSNLQHLFELCAPYSATGQRIALYQPNTSTGGGYTVPPAGGCMRTTGYANDGSGDDLTHCALVNMDANANKPDVVIHGTTYAPLAAFNINLHNLNDHSLFGRGVVARDLIASVNSSATLGDVFSIAGDDRAPRVVILKAILTPTSGSPKTLVTAKVSFTDDSSTDGGGGVPGFGVTVNSWSATPF